MNAERLLEVYGQISETPDAIARLRRFILDLAVRGKLVEQNSTDLPVKLASKKSLNTPLKTVPLGWSASTVGRMFVLRYGKGQKASERLENGPVPVFGSNGIVGYSKEFLTDKGAIIVGRKGSAGALNLCAGPSWTTDVAYFVEAPEEFDIQYLFLTLKSLNLDTLGKGVKPGLSRADVYPLAILIPPLAEQHRIVSKVAELMALCDRLEEARKTREETRDKLTAASFARLTASGKTPEDFRAHAAFALEALPALTTRPDQIKTLRQTILNLAVRGKLVEQDCADEPASHLLKRIEERRDELLSSGYPNPSEAKIQRKKQEQQTIPAGLPELPLGWCWSTLQRCSLMVIDCKNKTAPYSSSGVRLIRTTNVRNGRMNSNDQKFVTEATYEAWSLRGKPEPGDILITREAPMGEVCIIPENEQICLGQRMMLSRLVPNTINARFLLYSLQDPDLMERVQDKPLGMTVQHLRVGGVETLLVPLPPLAEQHRVVAKIDTLMSLLDRLEAALTTADTTRTRLLEALLREALQPANEALEAAE
ncbi:MAG: restriction endonuclease subunit S [Alphaproteobacteria bacterium]|nr:restriction endonuclease subunit S [Alphaproteobacteria bacterium]